MADMRLDLGRRGEDAVRRLLRKKGYRILHSNYRTPLGEVDLIAKEKDTLVFVEVKTRADDSYGPAAAAVHTRKQARIRRLAQLYMKEKGIADLDIRFDVVAVFMDPIKGRPLSVELIKDAF